VHVGESLNFNKLYNVNVLYDEFEISCLLQSLHDLLFYCFENETVNELVSLKKTQLAQNPQSIKNMKP